MNPRKAYIIGAQHALSKFGLAKEAGVLARLLAQELEDRLLAETSLESLFSPTQADVDAVTAAAHRLQKYNPTLV